MIINDNNALTLSFPWPSLAMVSYLTFPSASTCRGTIALLAPP